VRGHEQSAAVSSRSQDQEWQKREIRAAQAESADRSGHSGRLNEDDRDQFADDTGKHKSAKYCDAVRRRH